MFELNGAFGLARVNERKLFIHQLHFIMESLLTKYKKIVSKYTTDKSVKNKPYHHLVEKITIPDKLADFLCIIRKSEVCRAVLYHKTYLKLKRHAFRPDGSIILDDSLKQILGIGDDEVYHYTANDIPKLVEHFFHE